MNKHGDMMSPEHYNALVTNSKEKGLGKVFDKEFKSMIMRDTRVHQQLNEIRKTVHERNEKLSK